MIWILHTGGLGDLVLAAGLVAALKRLPGAPPITLAARRAVAPAAALYPVPPDAVVPLDVPAGTDLSLTPELVAQWQRQIAALGGTRADTVIAADLRPGVAHPVLAAALRPGRALVSEATWPAAFTRELLRELGLAAVPFTSPDVVGPQERQRYEALARLCGAHPAPPLVWTRPPRPAGFEHPYLACFPLSAPSNRAKRWPAERFGEVAAACRARRGWEVVLPGGPGEREELEAFAAGLGARIHLTGPDELPSHAAVVAHAAAYLGNSTGPYHLASAYRVPGVAVHSGDTWPNYGPWAPGSVGVVHPLGCFRCGHDCLFGRGVCTESIPAAVVTEALDRAIAQPDAAPGVVSIDRLDAAAHRMIGEANASYRAAQRDRAAQNECIVELHGQLAAAIGTIEAKHTVAAHLMQALRLARERMAGRNR